MSNEDWRRLQQAVEARIEDLHLTQAKIQAQGGPSPAKVREVVNGRARTFSASKRRDLERVLEWAPKSIDQVLSGGDPTELAEQPQVRLLRIRAMPDDQRTPEDAAFIADWEAAHPRRLDPSIWPDGEYRAFEAIFNDWQTARNRMLNLTLEYAATRKIPFQVAEQELLDVLQMAIDVRSGRPWTPPWNPGAEFREGEEPWKAEWWSIIEQNIEGISTVGFSYDIEKVRKNRAGDEQRQAEWDVHHQAETEKYYKAQAESQLPTGEHFEESVSAGSADEADHGPSLGGIEAHLSSDGLGVEESDDRGDKRG